MKSHGVFCNHVLGVVVLYPIKFCFALSIIAETSTGVLLCDSRFYSEHNYRFYSESSFALTASLVFSCSGFGRCFKPSSGSTTGEGMETSPRTPPRTPPFVPFVPFEKASPPTPRFVPFEMLEAYAETMTWTAPCRVTVPTPPPPPVRTTATIEIPMGVSREPFLPRPPLPPAWLVAQSKAPPPPQSLTATGEALASRIAFLTAKSGGEMDASLAQLHSARAKVAARLAEMQLRVAGQAQEEALRANAAVSAPSASAFGSGGSAGGSSSSAGATSSAVWSRGGAAAAASSSWVEGAGAGGAAAAASSSWGQSSGGASSSSADGARGVTWQLVEGGLEGSDSRPSLR